MKYIYFGDLMGDIKEESLQIRKLLGGFGIKAKIKTTDMPPFDEDFDVLFFDWGGMSLGNSMLESFCRQIIEEAENKPSRLYIMVSEFTKEAMEDALRYFKFEKEMPKNIFLTIKDAIPLLKAWINKDE